MKQNAAPHHPILQLLDQQTSKQKKNFRCFQLGWDSKAVSRSVGQITALHPASPLLHILHCTTQKKNRTKLNSTQQHFLTHRLLLTVRALSLTVTFLSPYCKVTSGVLRIKKNRKNVTPGVIIIIIIII